jgi:hypothetical protein
MITSVTTVNSLVDTFIMPTIRAVLEKYDIVAARFSTVNDREEGDFVITISINITIVLNSDRKIWVKEITNDILDALKDMGFSRENVDVHSGFNYYITFKNFEFHKKMLNYV